MIEDYVEIKILREESCKFDRAPFGYMLIGNKESGCVAFHVDLPAKSWFCSGTSSALFEGKSVPMMYLYDENNSEGLGTEICFPEYPGWSIHSLRMGNDELSVCLVDYDMFFKKYKGSK
jgi:hypothetical protein